MYIINKTLNNNVVIATKNDLKYILVGKGIGFAKKENDIINDENSIEKIFVSLDVFSNKDIDEAILGVTQEIIAIAENDLGENLNSRIHVGLTDHIHFAIKRIYDGINITNPFLSQTKALYEEEYNIAAKAVELIRERIGVDIPEDEIGFIALHIRASRPNVED